MSNTIRPQVKLTVVEEGTEFKGTLTSSCPIDVRGRVEGELATPVLTVSASGAVHGRAKVGEVRSLGEISGEFDADKIELAGVVRDNTVIRARSLDVKLASERGKLEIVVGECELSVGDDPRVADIVEPTLAVPAAAPEEQPAALAPADSLAAAVMAVEAPPAVAEPAHVAASPAETPTLESSTDEDDTDGDEAIDAQPAQAGKRKRRRKNGQDEALAGWSQPPSQPPPAN